MSTQPFSVAYRAPNIVDVLIPKVTNRTGYRLKASTQFDGSPAFVQIVSVAPSPGYLDPAVDVKKLHTMPGADRRVRIVFDPATFGPGKTIDAGLVDTMPFWMRFQPVDGGVAGADSTPVLVHPFDQHGEGRFAINGDAPNAATVAGSLTLCLGRRVQEAIIRNNSGANALFVAFNSSGPEQQIAANETYRTFGPLSDLLVVRGSGATVNFSGTFVIATG